MSRRTYVKRDNALGDVYAYDNADQLTGVQYNCTNPDTAPTSPSQTVNYTFDSAGNRTQVVDGTTNYTPNTNNQYTVVASSAITYDGRGNLASWSGRNYTYDASNRLTGYTDSFANAVSQAYDALGRCVKRVENGVTSYFVYDLSWKNLADYNSAGSQLYRYVNGLGANEVLSRTDGSSNVVYYHTDGLGSVTELTSIAGAVDEKYRYDINGVVTILNAAGTILSSSGFANRFLFTGAEFIASLGVYCMRARNYSAALGRFFQSDPIGHVGDVYNVYRYCGNDPVDKVDNFGLINWYTVGMGTAHFAGGVSGGFLIASSAVFAEALTGGFATFGAPVAIFAFTGAAGFASVGFANIVAGFNNQPQITNAPYGVTGVAAQAITSQLGGTPQQIEAAGAFGDASVSGFESVGSLLEGSIALSSLTKGINFLNDNSAFQQAI